MNILEIIEKMFYPALKNIQAKEFFNQVITEHKGVVPEGFYPPSIWEETVKSIPSMKGKGFDSYSFFLLNMAYTWAITKSEYCIDPELLKAVMKSDLSNNLPLPVLKTIPHWTGYVDLTDNPISMEDGDIEGFFISTVQNGGSVPGVTLFYPRCYKEGETVGAVFFPFEEGKGIMDCVVEDPAIAKAMREVNFSREMAFSDAAMLEEVEAVKKMLSIALLVASSYGEKDKSLVKSIFLRNYVRRSGKKYSLRFLNAHRKFAVGVEAAKELREARANAGPTDRAAHIRRAHYHGYWTGPRNDPNTPRTLRIKWIRETVVSATERKEK